MKKNGGTRIKNGGGGEGKDGGILRGLAALTTIGVTLVASTFAGLLIGMYLDSKFSTRPWLTIIFLVLGVIAGFRNIYYIVKRYGF